MTTPSRSARPPRARKRFGQHFLERAWIEKVVAAIAPLAHDVFLEIGPGRGAITWPLVERAKHVVAFEVDRDLARELREARHPRLTVVEGDMLDVTPAQLHDTLEELQLPQTGLRLVGNLPYNAASPILFKCVEFVESGVDIREGIVMLQREVAERIVAQPGTSEYGVLSILLRHVAEAERLLTLPPGAFRPPPEVVSTLLRLGWHRPSPAPRDLAVFRRLTRAVFTRRRKTLANALGAYALPPGSSASNLILEAGLDPRQRPETLDVPDFVRLSDAVASAAAR